MQQDRQIAEVVKMGTITELTQNGGPHLPQEDNAKDNFKNSVTPARVRPR